jgi:Putative beta-barrel porin-2, OmpL-like. bbp2
MKNQSPRTSVRNRQRAVRLAAAMAGASMLALGSQAFAADDVIATNADADPAAAASAPAAPAKPKVDNPYDHLGTNVFERFWNYNKLEWGQAGAPTDPTAPAAPSSRRAEIPPQPENSPPMPFTEWPYGGTTNLGTNRPSSVDSPFMVAIANTGVGKWMNDAHIQAYGWIDVGANISSNKVAAGNAPAAYDYNPNSFDLNQAVLYVERTPDTVQKDHIDWGFRFSAIYGSDYRYTTAFGVASYQLMKKNYSMGYDFPMVWGEVFIPQVADGLLVRVGRYISLPDIEAQLAPNNYMYSHSITYTFDNYTNTGVQATLAVNKNITVQFGVSVGSDTALWNADKKVANPYPNPLYPGATFKKDPGAIPSYTGCLRYQTDSAKDNIYFCADAINSGEWGYNNLQWYGVTYYHKFNDQWHVSIESYNLHQKNVPNINNATVQTIAANGGTPFSTPYFHFNAPNMAQCKAVNTLKCTATAQSALAYLNYQPGPLDNVSFRAEYYDDQEGQRTGTKTIYKEVGLGWQHWLSPQIELRPEYTYYWATEPAFNGNSNRGIAPNKRWQSVWAADAIVHF